MDFYSSVQLDFTINRIFEDLHSALNSEKMTFCKLKLFEMLMVLDSYNIDKTIFHKPQITRMQEYAVKNARQ